MAEQLTPQERLQPALLDRLTDEEPDKRLEPREQRVMSKARLRQAGLRGLAWLFNSTAYESKDNLAGMPQVRRSVLNYGLPPLSGQTASTVEVRDAERPLPPAPPDFQPP